MSRIALLLGILLCASSAWAGGVTRVPPPGGGGGSSDGLGTSGPKGPFDVTGPNSATMSPNSIGSSEVTDRTLTAADTTRVVFPFGNLGLTPAINWAQGETQIATIDQADATFQPFTGGVSGGNYTLILTQDASPGSLTWPAAVRWPSGMGPQINMDANSVTLVNCFYDGTNYNCVGGATGTEWSQDTVDPTTGNPACGTGDIRENTDTGAVFYCEDGATDTWRMIGEYTADPTRFVATMKVTARDIDDAPGVADGAGADPNPPPWSRVGKWFSGIFHNPDTYSIETIFSIGSWNYGGSTEVNPFLPQWAFVMEPAFGAGHRSGKEQQEIYAQWSVPQYRVTIASGGSGAISLGMNLTFTGGEICRPVDTDSDLSNGAVLPMVCSNAAGTARDAPDNGDTITACTGPASPAACSPAPTGTVSGSAFDQNIPIRPVFAECLPQYPGCTFKLERGITAAGVTMYYMLASPGDGTLHLGNSDPDDVNITQVFIPAHAGASIGSDNTPIVVQKAGGVGVDKSGSDDGAHNDTSALGGQLVVGDGNFSWFLLGPTKTKCGAFTSSGTTASDTLIAGINFREIVELTGFACRDDANTTSTAQMTMERASGSTVNNAIDFVGGAVPCGGTTNDLVYVLADTADADRELVTGASLRINGTSLNAVTPYSVCVSYRELPR